MEWLLYTSVSYTIFTIVNVLLIVVIEQSVIQTSSADSL